MGWTTRSSTISSPSSAHPLDPPPSYNPALSTPFVSTTTNMMACCASGMFGLVTAASSFTRQRQQPLEWKTKREKESSATGERRDHLSQQQRDPPVPQRKGAPPPDPSGRRGGPCVAGKATGTMQLGLVALAIVFLSSMGHSDALKLSKARRQRRGEFLFWSLFFLPLQHCCLSFLRSESQWWMSCKHLTSKVKITFCLFSHHFLFVFPRRVMLGSVFPLNGSSFFLFLRLCLSQFM